MKNLANKIVLIALIGCLILVEEGIFDNAVAALSTYEEVGILSVAAESNLAVGEERIELSACLEADLTALKSLPPEAEAVVIDRAESVLHIEARAVLIAVAEIVPVLPALVVESDALGVVIPAACKAVERVDVAQIVATLNELNAYLNTCYSHICKGIVHTLDKQADRIERAATNDIYVADVRIRRAGVCTPLNVQTDLSVLYGNVFNSCLSAAIDRNAACNAASVDDSTGDAVVASDSVNGIEGLSRTKTDESLVSVLPAVHSLDYCIVGEAESNAVLGVSGGAYRL